jgi:hypothetical protein
MRSEAGTVAFWISPVNWTRDNKVFSRFFAVHARGSDRPGSPRPFDVLLYKFRDEDAVYAFGMGRRRFQEFAGSKRFCLMVSQRGRAPGGVPAGR